MNNNTTTNGQDSLSRKSPTIDPLTSAADTLTRALAAYVDLLAARASTMAATAAGGAVLGLHQEIAALMARIDELEARR